MEKLLGQIIEGYTIMDIHYGRAVGVKASDEELPYAYWCIGAGGSLVWGKYFANNEECQKSLFNTCENVSCNSIDYLDDTDLANILCYDEGLEMDEAMEMIEDFMNDYHYYVELDGVEDRNDFENLLEHYGIPFKSYTDFNTQISYILY